MNSSKQIKIGAVLSYVSIAFNIISGLLYTPWMVDTIGKSQYGLYTLANSLITLFLVDFGLSSATARYLSKYNAEGDQTGAERFLGAVYKLYLIIDGIILCALTVIFFLLEEIYVNLTPAELAQFKVVYVICALFSVINFPFVTFKGILTAYEKFIPLKITDLLYRLCNIGFTVVALLLGYGLYALVIVHAVVGLLVLVIKYMFIRNTTTLKPNFSRADRRIYKEIFSFSLWMTMATMAMHLTINITPSILGMVANSEAIAVFGVITTIEGYSQTITAAINGMFMPRISKIMAQGNDLNPLLIKVGRFQIALNGLIVTGFTVIGNHFISLWMGEPYSLAYTGILLLLFPGLLYNSLQIASTAMIVEKKIKPCALVHILTGLINVTLSFPLSSHFGVTGACMSICVAYMVRNVLLHLIYHRELPLDIPAFMKACYVPMSVPLLLTLVYGVMINASIPDTGWFSLIFKGMMVIGAYLVLVFFFGLSKEERRNVYQKINKRK